MTKRKKIKKLILIIFLLIICSFLISTYYKTPQKQENNRQDLLNEQVLPIENVSPISAVENNATDKIESEKETVSFKNTENITIILGEEKINLLVPQNTLFYDGLMQAKKEGQIIFEGKNYPGLGFFITDIGTLHAGGGKNLLYYINGKEATVGVSSYTLKNGDIIEWKLK